MVTYLFRYRRGSRYRVYEVSKKLSNNKLRFEIIFYKKLSKFWKQKVICGSNA